MLTRNRPRKFPSFFNVIMIFFVLFGSLGLPANTHALGFAIEVNTSADNVIKDGLCSLREAITNAERNYQFYGDCTMGFSDDGIFFSDSLGTATITLTSVLPTIKDFNGLVIDGGGDITVSGDDLYQVFQIAGTGLLTLESLTVQNGNSAILGVGGGAWNIGGLTVQNSTFLNNTANSGGGIYNARTGSLAIINSNFSENNAQVHGAGLFNEGGLISIQNSSFSENVAGMQGGGIYTAIVSGFPVNVVTISGSSFSGNQVSAGSGGGIYSQLAGTLNISDTNFKDNFSSDTGGGIYNDVNGTLNLVNVNFDANGSSLGGAIYTLGAINLEDGDFTNNSAWQGGGIYKDHAQASTMEGVNFSKNVADFGAGIYNIKGDVLNITASSFVDNIGDGIHNEDGTIIVMESDFIGNRNGILSHGNAGLMDFAVVRVWNSNFTKNRISGIHNDSAGTNVFLSTFIGNERSGVYNINVSAVTVDRSTFQSNAAEKGGAIYNENSDLHVLNSTITENKALYGGGLYNTGSMDHISQVHVINTTFSGNSAKGNNIFNDKFTELHLYNTILTNRSAGDDCQNHGGTVTGGNNLIRSSGGGACNLLNGVNGNLIGVDPNLGILTGSPAYLPLNNGSPAINAGDDAQCAMLSNQSQNGVTRPQGAHCDIGSYEAPSKKK